MSLEISAQAAQAVMTLLKGVEAGTDLQNLSVINRVGMAVASSKSSTTDATAVTATASALIDLSEKMSESILHGKLRELLIRNTTGYDVLMAISKDLMIFCSLANSVRVGYYLGFLRELSAKLRKAIANELPPEQLAAFTKQEEERAKKEEEVVVHKPSANQDIDAMKNVIGFLDQWGEKEGEAAITPELIAQARAKTTPAGKSAPAPDLTAGISTDLLTQKAATASVTPPTKAAPAADLMKGIPEDLMASSAVPAKKEKPPSAAAAATAPQTIATESMDFDAIIKDIAVEAKEKPKKTEKPKYGITVYEDEVPPIPLEGLGTDSLQLLGSQASAAETPAQPAQSPASAPAAEETQIQPKPAAPPAGSFEYKSFEEEHGYGDAAVYDEDGQVVDFDSADEYNFDLNLKEQDAMSEALESLGWEEEKKKKKQEDKDKKKKKDKSA